MVEWTFFSSDSALGGWMLLTIKFLTLVWVEFLRWNLEEVAALMSNWVGKKALEMGPLLTH